MAELLTTEMGMAKMVMDTASNRAPVQPTGPPLSGQVALVTGAGRGIGQAIAMKLASLGARTVLCGREREPLDRVATEIQNMGNHASVLECDVTDRNSVEALAERIDRNFLRLDVLVNNAGIAGVGSPLHQLDPDIWDRVVNTNLRGVYYCIRSLVPIMIKTAGSAGTADRKPGGGHIINISSLAGKNALPNGAAYAASKWGLNGLSYSVAEELRPHNIRVSVICPGSTHTEFSPHPGKNADKMLQTEDVAHVAAMLVTQAPQSFASEVLLRPTQKP